MAYIRSLPTPSISLQLLSFKALFLAINSSIFRVSSMGRLAPSLEETWDSAILYLLSLEKQSREGRIRRFFQIPKIFEDKEICPVLALQTYFSKVRSANFEIFHITHLYPCRCPVSTETICLSSYPMSSHISRWQPGLLPGGCSKPSPRLESIPRSGLHTLWERLQVHTTPRPDNWTWDKFVSWPIGLWPVVFSLSFISSTFDTIWNICKGVTCLLQDVN